MQSDMIADRYRQILNEQMSGLGPAGYGGARKGSHCKKMKKVAKGKKRCAEYTKARGRPKKKGGVAVGGVAVGGKRKGSKKQKAAASRSPWIQHVKQWAADHGMTYGEAMRDPRCSASYHKMQ